MSFQLRRPMVMGNNGVWYDDMSYPSYQLMNSPQYDAGQLSFPMTDNRYTNIAYQLNGRTLTNLDDPFNLIPVSPTQLFPSTFMTNALEPIFIPDNSYPMNFPLDMPVENFNNSNVHPIVYPSSMTLNGNYSNPSDPMAFSQNVGFPMMNDPYMNHTLYPAPQQQLYPLYSPSNVINEPIAVPLQVQNHSLIENHGYFVPAPTYPVVNDENLLGNQINICNISNIIINTTTTITNNDTSLIDVTSSDFRNSTTVIAGREDNSVVNQQNLNIRGNDESLVDSSVSIISDEMDFSDNNQNICDLVSNLELSASSDRNTSIVVKHDTPNLKQLNESQNDSGIPFVDFDIDVVEDVKLDEILPVLRDVENELSSIVKEKSEYEELNCSQLNYTSFVENVNKGVTSSFIESFRVESDTNSPFHNINDNHPRDDQKLEEKTTKSNSANAFPPLGISHGTNVGSVGKMHLNEIVTELMNTSPQEEEKVDVTAIVSEFIEISSYTVLNSDENEATDEVDKIVAEVMNNFSQTSSHSQQLKSTINLTEIPECLDNFSQTSLSSELKRTSNLTEIPEFLNNFSQTSLSSELERTSNLMEIPELDTLLTNKKNNSEINAVVDELLDFDRSMVEGVDEKSDDIDISKLVEEYEAEIPYDGNTLDDSAMAVRRSNTTGNNNGESSAEPSAGSDVYKVCSEEEFAPKIKRMKIETEENEEDVVQTNRENGNTRIIRVHYADCGNIQSNSSDTSNLEEVDCIYEIIGEDFENEKENLYCYTNAKKKGRPKGSKKVKVSAVDAITPLQTITNFASGTHKRGRGRPKGSKTKNHTENPKVNNKNTQDVLTCNMCQVQFESLLDFMNHHLSVHRIARTNVYHCGFCRVTVEDVDQLFQHMHNHNFDTNLQVRMNVLCPMDRCDSLTFGSVFEFSRHLKENHDLPRWSHNGCSKCDDQIVGKLQYVEHIKSAHTKTSAKGDMCCDSCDDEIYRNEDDYADHVLTNHLEKDEIAVACSICGNIYSSFDICCHVISEHSQISVVEKPKYYRCVICGSGFGSLTKLTKHVCTKLDTTICSICHQSFPSKKRLAYHLQFHYAKDFPLQCDVCLLTFEDETKSYDHIRFHHESTTIPCEVCGEIFKSRVGLIIHQQYHSGERNYICQECGKGFFNNTTLKEHEVSHMAIKPHKCEICGTTLSRASRLRTHLKTHSINYNQNIQSCYRCVQCCFVSPSEKKVLYHVCSSKNDKQKVEYDIITVDKVYLCEYCGECFSDSGFLHTHKQILHDCGGQDKLYSCNQCGTRFSAYSRLATHRLSHGITTESFIVPGPEKTTNTNPENFIVPQVFSCEICPKLYSQYTSFNYHRKFGKHKSRIIAKTDAENVNDIESTIKQSKFYCDMCSHNFVNEKNLETHKTKYHGIKVDDVENHTCWQCGKRYASKATLKVHEQIHTNSNASRCPHCEKSFNHPLALRNHIRRKNCQADKFLCEYCGQTFVQQSDKDKHIRNHTGERPFKCDLCNKSFICMQALSQHKKVHKNQDSLICKICSRTFKSIKRFETHMENHKKNNLNCDTCGDIFLHKYELKKHLKKHKEVFNKTFSVDVYNQPITVTITTPDEVFEALCPKCGSKFGNLHWLQTHMEDCQDSAEELTNICKLCLRSFPDKLFLDKHMVNDHLNFEVNYYDSN